MTEKEKQINIWLNQIADELNITPTMLDKAVKSYTAVGTWLSDGIPYDVKITPQGSMNLGTVIRPITEKDEYDVDLVCLLKNGGMLPLGRVKGLVGDRLRLMERTNRCSKKKVSDAGLCNMMSFTWTSFRVCPETHIT